MEPPRFVADAMLGRLARWLRLLGFDTAYDPDADDQTLGARSLREGRILLTRDHRMSLRKAWRVIRLDSDRVAAQLAELRQALDLPLHPDRFFTRCALCNGVLRSVTKPEVRDRVPERVLAETAVFRRCDACDKVFWKGSHRDLFFRAAEAGLGGQTIGP